MSTYFAKDTSTAQAALPKLARPPGGLPLLQVDDIGGAIRWAAEHREALRAAVLEHGSLLVRGLRLQDVTGTEAVFRQLGSLMTEREAFSPRHHYSDVLYSSSKWPPNQPMCMHHELSYALQAPSLMLFACLTAPAEAGATPLADGEAMLHALPAEIVARFEETGWLLVRNYNDEIGASVADAFGTESRDEVERYCRANDIRFEWRPGGALRTWQRRGAVVRHPRTGRRCWYNQIAFLNEWTIDPEVREYLVDICGEDGLPFNTRFGNGDPIGPDIVQRINQAYSDNTVREQWQSGDMLLVDNIRTAHGRESYAGQRQVLVAMADAVCVNAFSPAIDVVAA